jgi:hypothetical protein
MNLSERAKKTYTERFSELSEVKRFHFATRIKNFYGVSDFNDYLQNNVPKNELPDILDNNDFSEVNFYESRKEFFEKYDRLYSLEAALFRVNHLKNEYDIDIREELTKLYPKEKIFSLCDELLEDSLALKELSTYAVNVLCLSEQLYPREKDVVDQLCDFVLSGTAGQSQEMVYFVTHIILCSTSFYTQSVPSQYAEKFRAMLEKCEDYILENYATTSLDIKLEYLVCVKLVDTNMALEDAVREECEDCMSPEGYLLDWRRPARLNSLEGAEHRNVLFVMSGI